MQPRQQPQQPINILKNPPFPPGYMDMSSPQNVNSFNSELAPPTIPPTLLDSALNIPSIAPTQHNWYYEVEFKRSRRDIFYGRPEYAVGNHVKVL